MPEPLFAAFLAGVLLELAALTPVLRGRRFPPAVAGALLISAYALRDADFTLLAGAWLLVWAGLFAAPGRSERP